MKKCIVAALLMVVARESFSQADSAFTFKTGYIHEFVRNFSGGLSTGNSFNGRIGVSMGFDTKKANWWKGGYFFVQGFGIYSGLPSSNLIGDIQPISRIEASDRICLFDFWYRQDLGPVQLLIGQHDMNSLFGVNRLAGTLINTSFGIYPSIGLGTPFSIYPASTSAVVARVKVSPSLLVQAAAYDGKPLAHKDNPYNVKRDWNLLDEVFTTGEITYSRPSDHVVSNVYKLGIFYHNGSYTSPVDGVAETGRTGAYFNMQTYFIAREDRKLGTFLQIGSANAKSCLVDMYGSAGINLEGIFSRKYDAVSLGVVSSSINNRLVEEQGYASHRTVVELNYQLALNKYIRLQPDLQYIIHPGAQINVPNAFAGILRLSLQF